MTTTTATRHINRYPILAAVSLALSLLLLLTLVSALLPALPAQDNDWSRVYALAARRWLAGENPYDLGNFGSPPWTLFGLAPFAYVHPVVAMLPAWIALFYLAHRRRKSYLILLVGTSFPFIAGSVWGNIDWLVMAGVVIGGRLGVILATVKPQDGALAVVAEVAKCKTWRERVKLLLPLSVLALLSAPLLLEWLRWMPVVGASNNGIRNFSLFPYSVPLGLIALWYTWKRRDPLLGVIASLCFAPYFYIHSLMPLMFAASDRDWRYGAALNAATWGIVGLILVGVIPISL